MDSPANYTIYRYNMKNDDDIIDLLMSGPIVVSLAASSWSSYNPLIKLVHSCGAT